MAGGERVTESRRAFSGRIVQVRVDTVELPTGKRVEREIVEHRGSVAMVALDEQGQALLVRQHRAAVGEALLEVPAGSLNPDEAAQRAAERELAEELNMAAARWTLLATFYTSPGFLTERMHLYLAEGLSHAEGRQDEDESISVERLPLAEVPARIAAGAIRDAKTIAGLLLALERRGRDLSP